MSTKRLRGNEVLSKNPLQKRGGTQLFQHFQVFEVKYAGQKSPGPDWATQTKQSVPDQKVFQNQEEAIQAYIEEEACIESNMLKILQSNKVASRNAHDVCTMRIFNEDFGS